MDCRECLLSLTYSDGTPIPEVTDLQQSGASLTTGAWCYFDNDPTKTRLYNWFAIVGLHDNDPNTPLKEFAPEGWRVPSDNDWEVFLHYLQSNGYNLGFPPDLNRVAKSLASTTGWINTNGSTHPGNNQSSNNSSGFNAYPFGVRIWNNFDNGGFVAENVRTTFWSNRQNNDDAKVWSIYAESSQLENFYSRKKNAYSVRFIRD